MLWETRGKAGRFPVARGSCRVFSRRGTEALLNPPRLTRRVRPTRRRLIVDRSWLMEIVEVVARENHAGGTICRYPFHLKIEDWILNHAFGLAGSEYCAPPLFAPCPPLPLRVVSATGGQACSCHSVRGAHSFAPPMAERYRTRVHPAPAAWVLHSSIRGESRCSLLKN